jgi:DNA-binding SARP family transcriptional activator
MVAPRGRTQERREADARSVFAAASKALAARRAVTASAGSVMASSGVRLELLNGFDLRHAGRPIRLPLSARRLLVFLALHDRALHRLYVAGSLWLDSSQEHANGNLRTALWRLRRPECPLVDATAMEIALAPSVTVDLRDATARANRVLAHDIRQGDLDGLCVAGDLLPDWYDDWLLIERERFRQLRLRALESLGEYLAGAGQYAAAAQAGLAAVAGEPLRESAHRVLIRIHIAEGNFGDAIRQYRIYEAILRTQLGLEPSESIRGLIRALPANGQRPLVR